MNKLIIYSVVLFSIIISVEILILFSKSSSNKNLVSTTQQKTATPTTILISPTIPLPPQLDYKPVREYTGRVISFGFTTDNGLYELTYTNSDNLKGTILFNADDASKTTIQYLNNAKEVIKEQNGLQADSLQPQDKFDIMISDNENDQDKEIVIDKILIKIYID